MDKGCSAFGEATVERRELRLLSREMLISLLLHAFLVASVCAISPQVNRECDPIVVFLGPDGGGSSTGGGGALGGQAFRKKKPDTRGPKQGVSAKTHTPDGAINKDMPDDQLVSESREGERLVARPPEQGGEEAGGALQAEEAAVSAGNGGTAGSGGGSGTGTGFAKGSGSGSGSGIGTGSLRGHGEGFGEGNAKSRYLREHFAYIRDLILKHLDYPPLAKKLGWMGSLTVSFVICENGYTEPVRIVKSSGYETLDQNVVRTIKHLQPFPRPPVKAELVIPVLYRLQ